MTQAQALLQAIDKRTENYDSDCNSILDICDFVVAKAIHQRELTLSISPLLGCDYLFINHQGPHPLLAQEQLATTLQELLEVFESSPRQSQLVSINEAEEGQLTFTRYDYIWENNQIQNVTASRITHSEQIDFMIMMYNCSSMC
jgi:uncharacterized alpha-E superfamily protein